MSLYPGKIVKLVDRNSDEVFIYEVSQIIYGTHILGVACITEQGVQDFYFSDYVMQPLPKGVLKDFKL
jgi:hypothetical protein